MMITPAFAQAAAGAAPAPDLISMLVPFALIFVVFYFLLIRPQQKRMKEHQTMLAALRRGDQVVTGGGMFGSVAKLVGDDEVLVEIAPGVQVRMQRSAIVNVVAKPEPAKDAKPATKAPAKSSKRKPAAEDGTPATAAEPPAVVDRAGD